MRYIFYSHFTKKLAFKSTTILMPFRKKNKTNWTHWFPLENKQTKKLKNKHVGRKMGQKNLDLRTKLGLPIYLLPSCFKNVISTCTVK